MSKLPPISFANFFHTTVRPFHVAAWIELSGIQAHQRAMAAGIRQQVCRILEDGSDAFLKRERRYSLAERQASINIPLGKAEPKT